MMLLWSFKTMKERQLFWTAFCVLSLLENQVSGDVPTSAGSSSSNSPSTEQPPTTISSTSTSKAAVDASSSKAVAYNSTSKAVTDASTSKVVANASTSAATPSIVPSGKSTGKPKNETASSSSSSSSTTAFIKSITSMHTTVQSSPAQESTPGTPSNMSAETITSTMPLISAFTKQVKSNFTDSPTTAKASDSSVKPSIIKCVNIKDVATSSKVICLELNVTNTCQQFLESKGAILENVICKKKPCHIKLAESSMKRNCILLFGHSNKDTEELNKDLESDKLAFSQLGIKSYKQESIESHKDYSRKTLIALVTSGLLLAFLGLAGYHLMKRRSWSPMGERLGEDPYYTENGSHGNPVISVASYEHSDLQDKPNINGGAQENGTGQASSKNGQSSRPHVADTEL